MEPIPLYVFLMVLAAATVHAIWNFFARKVKGNLAVIFLSLYVGAILWLPPTIYFYFRPLFSTSKFPLTSWQGAVVTIATGLIHSFYFVFLGISYRHGEISVVYPIARGTGVALTAVVAYIFLGERAGLMGIFGMTAIVVGILAIGLKFELLQGIFKRGNTHVKLKEISQEQEDVELPTVGAFSLEEEEETTEQTDEMNSSGEVPDKENQQIDEPTLEEPLPLDHTHKNNLTSLGCAFIVGICICAYSTIDKVGVSIVDIDPITYAFFLALFAALGMSPYMLWKFRPECSDAAKNLKPYVASVGPLTLLSYTVILFAYRAADVSLVVAEREISVVIGAILGFTFLKEKVTWQKVIGIICILTGLILVKLES
eukprot:Phypoly_transcript_11097.p1 GENE.Phypoly_transcript_11097~~Phypoly_transcript_11097.p1  ORF type:complete len:395 (+),score=42.72 Phypoly_transcript_11097:75-1187(+)